VVFDQNTLAREWREQVRCCEEQDIALHRNIDFALAVANVLEFAGRSPPHASRYGRFVRTDLSQQFWEPGSSESSGAFRRSRGDGSGPIRKGSLLTGI
jgi:hypothetical protein